MNTMNCTICKGVRDFVDFAMEKFRQFDIKDAGIFKICLIAFGILMGMYWHKQFKKASPFIWLIFIASYGYLIYTLFFKKEDL